MQPDHGLTPEEIAKYDIDGDGELNDAEIALAQMDKSGSSALTKDQMHALTKEHLST